jgi:CHAD domain-containing protein
MNRLLEEGNRLLDEGSKRARRGLARALEDRRAQLAAGGLAVAGAALAGGRAVLTRRKAPDYGPSPSYRIARDEAPAIGVRRIALRRLDSALEHLRGRDEEDPVTAVHETRKDLKKTRSVLRLVRDEIGDDVYRRENDRFRDAGRLLAPYRDAQVKLETLEILRERFADEVPERAWGSYASGLRSETGSELEGNGGIGQAAHEIGAGRAEIDEWPVEANDWALIAPGVRRSYRRGRNRLADVVADPSDAAVHEWRKRVKDLWYHLRLLRDSEPERLGKLADRAHELSDLLGDHHDLAVLRDDARSRPELLDGDERELLSTLIERRQEELLAQAVSLGDDLYAEKPKAFTKRLEKHWNAWR